MAIMVGGLNLTLVLLVVLALAVLAVLLIRKSKKTDTAVVMPTPVQHKSMEGTSAINENQSAISTGNPMMKRCPVCGREIAKSAKVCPGCGAKNKRPMNKKVWLIVVIVLALAVVFFIKIQPKEEIRSVGSTVGVDGINFVLYDFCLAERTDHDTYNPKAIDGASWGANDGYIFAYLNYRIINYEDETFDHFMDMDITVEYGDGVYGDSLADWKASSEGDDPYNLDVAPDRDKTYHHVISNCSASLANPTETIRVVVEIRGERFIYEIPADQVEVTQGEEVLGSSVDFTEADDATKQFVSNILMQNTYTWRDGNIDCELTFGETQAQLLQNMAGTNFVATGEYVVGTDKIKVNYGNGDVFYGWTKNGESIDLHLIE